MDTQYLIAIAEMSPWERLQYTCELYKQRKLNRHEFVRYIHNCFADDNGMDWIDKPSDLIRFRNAILNE